MISTFQSSLARVAPLLVALVVVLAAPANAVAAAPGDTVVELRVEGSTRVTRAQLEQVMRTRVGDPLDRSVVQDDIRQVYARFGVRMEVVEVPTGGGVALRLLLDEERLVTRVVTRGVEPARGKELLEEASLDRVRATMESELRARALELQQRMFDEGRYYASVGVSFEEQDGERVAVLEIAEGPEVAVDDIDFVGADHLDHGRLREVMQIGESTLYVFKSWLKRDVLDRDLIELERFVREEGFRDATVTLESVTHDDEDREWADILIRVDEGTRYQVESIEIEGNQRFIDDDLLGDLILKPGAPIRVKDLRKDVQTIRDRYGALGHVRCAVEPEVRFAESGAAVRVLIRIDEGAEKTIRDVVIRGNTDTLDEVVRRQVTLSPGDVASTAEVERTEDRLRALTYFMDDHGRSLVHAELRETSDPLLEDLFVDVEETRSGRLFFTAGVMSDIGFFAGVQLEKRNFDLRDTPSSWNPITLLTEFWRNEAFHGGGQLLEIRVLPGSQVTDIQIRFQEPYLFGPDEYPWSLGVDLYSRTTRLFDEYREERLGLTLTLGKQLSDRWSDGVFTRIDVVDIGDVDGAPDDVDDVEGSNFVPSIGVFARYQDLDSVFRPTEGVEWGARYEILFADAAGNRLVLDGRWFIPLEEDDRGRPRVVALRGAIGASSGFGGELPFFERFTGGGTSGDFALRGFEYRGVGPEEGGVHLGGEFAYSLGAEYEYPIYSNYDPVFDEENEVLRGVAFVDLGSVEGDLGRLFGSTRLSVGAGIRLRLPALGPAPIALDLGIPLLSEADDQTEVLSVRISTRF